MHFEIAWNIAPILGILHLNQERIQHTLSRWFLFGLLIIGGLNQGSCAEGFGVCCVCKYKIRANLGLVLFIKSWRSHS